MVNRPDPTELAHAAEDAIHQLCRALRTATVMRPAMTPAAVDRVLAHLAEAVAALPQAARQLSEILEQTTHDHLLQMDDMADTHDPAVAIGTARLHLDATATSALGVHGSLDAARQQTAHIASTGQRPDIWAAPAATASIRRAEDRTPPPVDRGRGGPGPSR